MPDKLPKGWVKTTLGEVCAPVATVQPAATPNAEFTYFDIGGIDNESNRIAETKTVTGREAPSRARQVAQTGDILFSTVRTYLKKIARIERDYPSPVASTGFTVIRAAEGVSSQFLFFRVLSEDFLQPLHPLQSGSSYPAVRDKDVFAQPIPLPPSREQERIVAKLDALLSRVAAGEAAARRALERLKRYRAAVLHAAVTGELTRDWRKTHKPGETGAELLKRLLQERRARWEAAELKRLQAAGKPPKDDKWKKSYEEPTPPKTDGLPSLPRDWAWTNLNQLKVYSLYGPRFGKSDYTKKGVAVLRTTDIDERGRVSLESCPKLPLTEADYQKYKVEVGDLLITRTGSIGTLAVFNDTVRAIPGAYLLHYRLITPALVDMVYTFLNSPKGQKQLWEGSAGSGRQNLSAPGLESISLPLPPLSEQTEIVRQVELRQTAADRLAANLDRQLARARATRQSLLREAFAGNLLPQDPKDESASILLDRIRATREAEAKKPKPKRMPKQTSKAVRRPLLEVLRSHKKPISPEQLFRESGFQQDFENNECRQEIVDKFYEELRAITGPGGPVQEKRPNRNTVLLEVKP